MDLRFNFDYYNCIEPALVAVLFGFLVWFKHKHLARQPFVEFFPLSQKSERSSKKFSHLDGIRFALLGCSFFSLCLFSAWGVQATFDNSLKTAACCFEAINQYEIAEKIYQRVSCKGIYSALATWQTRSKKEDQLRELPRNAAVANVYGNNSLQMAERCFFVASSRMNHDDGDMYDEIAYSWFEKARRIYERNNAPAGEIDCLSQMVLLKENESNVAVCTALLKRAAALTVNVDKVRYEYHYDGLNFMAAQKGLHDESVAFGKVSDKIKRSAAASQAADDEVRPYVMCTAVLLAILAAGLGQVTLSELSLNRTNRDFLKRFMGATDNSMRLALLNNSISIDLMQHNFDTALAKSEYLLQLAHGNSLALRNLPSNFDWTARRQKKIFKGEIFSAAVAVVLLSLIYV